MRELEKPVARVFRRLRYQRFLTALVWSLAIGLVIVAGVIGAAKALNRRLPGPDWVPFAVAGGLWHPDRGPGGDLHRSQPAGRGGGHRPCFHLNERLSSALTLPDDLRETPAGRP